MSMMFGSRAKSSGTPQSTASDNLGRVPMEAIQAAFKEIDGDGDGQLRLDELLAAAHKAMGTHFVRERIEYLIKTWDTDGSGSLNLGEFGELCSYLQTTEAAAQRELDFVWRCVSNLRMGVDDSGTDESSGNGIGEVKSDSSGATWTAAGFIRSVGVGRPVAKALLHGMPQGQTQIETLRSLGGKSVSEIQTQLLESGVVKEIAAVLQPRLQELRNAGRSA